MLLSKVGVMVMFAPAGTANAETKQRHAGQRHAGAAIRISRA
jgi:hypothetical protein